ncbi:unnamed protein product [Bursaphelenchus xylophilus]|uniref:(pine wood nematode) hypothetical protein n=1 Tax=Bursaphelenchus xylophilus TaxID=6326 RepID=A0A1I7RT69_BURXY|nr:unnamed protein product [Bursaphelenchus xylophilus]CAG9122572.1 unnamed protein product [Bursaphelenchus xylophilus]
MSEATCYEAEQTLSAYTWLFMMSSGLLNFCTILVLLLALYFLIKIPKLGKEFKEITVALCLAAMRNGIGTSAKTALFTQAQSKPELAKLFKYDGPAAAPAQDPPQNL